ncbi:hypothetical protein C8Q80DRAFT_1209639 [Daedaleopsis nitida]|nr:hypothetical protein C8Q80DRAFT_1209639 [Daedaleopsis nitida]
MADGSDSVACKSVVVGTVRIGALTLLVIVCSGTSTGDDPCDNKWQFARQYTSWGAAEGTASERTFETRGSTEVEGTAGVPVGRVVAVVTDGVTGRTGAGIVEMALWSVSVGT